MHVILKIIKTIKIRNIVFLIFLLLFNTYAWFIYATRVSSEISVHVSSWSIEFVSGNNEITKDLVIAIERVYPGMETFEKKVEVHNKGERKAKLDYEIKKLKVMGEEFIVDEENGITGEFIENKMKNEYPFKMIIETKDDSLDVSNGKGEFIISLQWDFESGDDEKDTLWGNRAYEYYSLHPNEESIQLELKLKATQAAE